MKTEYFDVDVKISLVADLIDTMKLLLSQRF